MYLFFDFVFHFIHYKNYIIRRQFIYITHISGIKGGLLMCETRQSARPARKEQEHNDTPKQVSTSSDRISDKIFSSERRRPDKRPQKNSHSPSFKAQVPMMDVDGFKVVSKKRNV